MTGTEQIMMQVEDYEMAIYICQRSDRPQPKLLDMLKTNLIQKQKTLLDLETNKIVGKAGSKAEVEEKV